MDYTTDLLEREPGDENGQELCNHVAMHLTYLSEHGLDGFMLVPVQNDGRTVSVIVAAKGRRPGSDAAREAFVELTGLKSPAEIGEFLGVSPEVVAKEFPKSN